MCFNKNGSNVGLRRIHRFPKPIISVVSTVSFQFPGLCFKGSKIFPSQMDTALRGIRSASRAKEKLTYEQPRS